MRVVVERHPREENVETCHKASHTKIVSNIGCKSLSLLLYGDTGTRKKHDSPCH
jgi:hypothetical protein